MNALISYIPRQLCVLALVAPTTRTQRLVAFAVIFASQMWTAVHHINDPSSTGILAAIAASGMSGFVLIALNLLLDTHDPRTSITWPKPSTQTTTPPTGPNTTQSAKSQRTCFADESLGLPSRIWWAYSFTYSQRMTGTSAEAANTVPLPPLLSSSRWSFCVNRLFTVAKDLLIVFLLVMTLKHSQFALDCLLNPSPTFFQRALASTGGILFLRNAMNAGQCLLACLSVALRVCEPEEWPDLFGAPSDAYTVRKAWGRAWHQLLRKPLAQSGDAVAHFFGAKPRTFASKYVKLYVGFALSTFVHMWGDFVVHASVLPPDLRSKPWAKFSLDALFSPQFFMSQAVVIMVEDHVVDAIEWVWRTGRFRRIMNIEGSSDAKEKYPPASVTFGRMVGYVWVFVWLSMSVHQYGHDIMRRLYFELPPSMSAI